MLGNQPSNYCDEFLAVFKTHRFQTILKLIEAVEVLKTWPVFLRNDHLDRLFEASYEKIEHLREYPLVALA